ncbi:unnamed protein product [Penicillium salamii]|nr:unnamed protein product [Penicillium salamii]
MALSDIPCLTNPTHSLSIHTFEPSDQPVLPLHIPPCGVTPGYYGITFDHLVPTGDTNPEVLQINIVGTEDDAGVYANKHNPFEIDPREWIGKKVLAVRRCYQNRKGTTDRVRVNDAANARDGG